ncbi:MAG: hypothetical protein V3575_00205 [Candidatus Absconditabacteria bacterium]
MNKKYILIAVLVILALLGAVAFKFYYLDSVVPNPTKQGNIIIEQNPIDLVNDDLVGHEIDNGMDDVEFSQDYFERPNIEINSGSNIDE